MPRNRRRYQGWFFCSYSCSWSAIVLGGNHAESQTVAVSHNTRQKPRTGLAPPASKPRAMYRRGRHLTWASEHQLAQHNWPCVGGTDIISPLFKFMLCRLSKFICNIIILLILKKGEDQTAFQDSSCNCVNVLKKKYKKYSVFFLHASSFACQNLSN